MLQLCLSLRKCSLQSLPLVHLDFYITRLVVRANLKYQGLAQEKNILMMICHWICKYSCLFFPFFFWVWGFQNSILPPLVFYVWLIAAMLSNSLYDVQMLHLSSPPSICIKHVIFIFLFVALAFSFFFLTLQAEFFFNI